LKIKGAENAAWALVGGNRNNAGLCGAGTVNLNNPLSNPNSNIGAALSFLWQHFMYQNTHLLFLAARRKLSRNWKGLVGQPNSL